MPIKDIQENRDYQREWIRRKNLGLDTKIKPRIIMSLEEKKEHMKESRRKYRIERYAKNKEKLSNIIGSYCILCDATTHLIAHEIYGEHHAGDGTNLFVDAFERPKDFVRVCFNCHKGIHWAMKHMGMTWEEITERVKNKRKINK